MSNFNSINFGSVIFDYDWNMKFIGLIIVKDLLKCYKGMPNYDLAKQFLDARAKDRKIFQR